MKTYRLVVPLWATAYVNVEVPDDILAGGEGGIREYVMENAELPGLCAQCSGWGRSGFSLELGDEADWDKAEVEARDE